MQATSAPRVVRGHGGADRHGWTAPDLKGSIPFNPLTTDLFGNPLPTSVHTYETSPGPDSLTEIPEPLSPAERFFVRFAADDRIATAPPAIGVDAFFAMQSPATPAETSRRHGWWETERAAVREAMSRAGFPLARLDRFDNCGAAAFVLVEKRPPYRHRRACNKCRDRHCKPCSIERANKYAANVKKRLDQYRGRINRRFRFLTLTLRSSAAPLDQQFRRFITCFAKLRNFKLGDVQQRRTRVWWAKYVVGGCYFLEATLNAGSGLWHVHAHCIVEGRFLPVDELRSLWRVATGDSGVVDVRELSGVDDVAAEISKYTSKGADAKLSATGDKLVEWMIATKSLRLCATFGTWRGFRLAAPLDDYKGSEWVNLGREDDLRARAALGDDWAARVVSALEKDTAPGRKSQPPPVVSPNFAPQATDSARAGAH